MKTLHSAHAVGGKQKQALGTVTPVCNSSPRNRDLEFQGSLGYTVRKRERESRWEQGGEGGGRYWGVRRGGRDTRGKSKRQEEKRALTVFRFLRTKRWCLQPAPQCQVQGSGSGTLRSCGLPSASRHPRRRKTQSCKAGSEGASVWTQDYWTNDYWSRKLIPF